MNARRRRLVVCISGNGSNLQAILDACAEGVLPAVVAGVVSDKPQAFGLQRAARAGVPTCVLQPEKGVDRRAYDSSLAALVQSWRPDWVILAGWMRLLTSKFLERFPGRVINLHPALPGKYPGTHAIERAFEAWQKGETDRSGVMVHLVPDEGVDNGPVLAFEELHFLPDEQLAQFEARIHQLEHKLLVRTLRQLLADADNGSAAQPRK